jgi:hypothetical protein
MRLLLVVSFVSLASIGWAPVLNPALAHLRGFTMSVVQAVAVSWLMPSLLELLIDMEDTQHSVVRRHVCWRATFTKIGAASLVLCEVSPILHFAIGHILVDQPLYPPRLPSPAVVIISVALWSVLLPSYVRIMVGAIPSWARFQGFMRRLQCESPLLSYFFLLLTLILLLLIMNDLAHVR